MVRIIPTDAADDIIIVIPLIVLCMMFHHPHAKLSDTMTCSSILEKSRCVLDSRINQISAEVTVLFSGAEDKRGSQVHGMSSARHRHVGCRSAW